MLGSTSYTSWQKKKKSPSQKSHLLGPNWGNGAQILSPHDKNIQKAILDNLEPHPEALNIPDENNSLLKNPLEEISSSYLSSLPINNSKDDNGQKLNAHTRKGLPENFALQIK